MFKRKFNRLTNFDYSVPNYYFVTVCTQDKIECFGNIVDGKISLSEQGLIVSNYWKEIPTHYKGVMLDESIVMPNHLHGIVIIEDVAEATGLQSEMAASGPFRLASSEVSRRYNLSTIVGSFKNISSKTIHQAGFTDFCWQKSFYDHVIRQDESLDKIREYIRNNPLKWELDRNNPQNIWM